MVLAAICALCDETITAAQVFEHYQRRHPDRHRGDWELACWPDGAQVLLEDAAGSSRNT